MNLPYQRVHVVGAAGAGMSALAKILLRSGHVVTGSDLRGGPALETLGDMGAVVRTGHHPDMTHDADLVVASSAVPEYDEELEEARRLGKPVWRRPELIGALTEDIRSVGATGTHGKTTTTAMIIKCLRGAGLDPSFILGGDLVELGTNGHLGETDLLVVEADEAFRTFESIHLDGLVITNVEEEHVEHFGDGAGLLDSFTAVARAVNGPVVACADDPGSAEVAERAGAETYGTAPSATWKVEDLVGGRDGSTFTLVSPGGNVPVKLVVPGKHVALNAAGALSLLARLDLGLPLDDMAKGLASFRGVGRRWEHRGTVAGIALYDDYAHHPTEVRVTLAAARNLQPARLWAVFQPHLYSRTERFSEEFGEALAGADVVVVTDVFGAREEPVPGVTGALVADAAARHGVEAHYVPHRADLAEFLVGRLTRGDLVLSMGAGDITLLHGELAGMLGGER